MSVYGLLLFASKLLMADMARLLLKKPGPVPGFSRLPNVRYWLPFQPVDATHAANRSAGVSKSNVFRGRSFSSLATQFKCAWE